jgi:FkbM family methyltransferase
MEPLEMDIGVDGYNFRMGFDITQAGHRDIFLAVALSQRPYQPDVAQVLLNILEPGDTFIDIGAHIGWFTLLGAKIVGPFGRVFAIEPDVLNYRHLKRNLKINGLNGSVYPHRMVVSNETGKIKLYLNQDTDGGHALWPVWKHPANVESNKTRKTTKVRSTTLDNLCEQEGIRGIKLVKIDTEGAEGAILMGASGLLSEKRIPHIVMEVNDDGLKHMGSNIEEIGDMMDGCGYSCLRLMENVPSDVVYNVLFSLKG